MPWNHHVERLEKDHKNAKRLALALSEIKGVSVNPDQVETNIVIFDVDNTGMTAQQVSEDMKQQGVLIHAVNKRLIRLVTHLDVSSAGIEKALKAFKKVLGS